MQASLTDRGGRSRASAWASNAALGSGSIWRGLTTCCPSARSVGDGTRVRAHRLLGRQPQRRSGRWRLPPRARARWLRQSSTRSARSSAHAAAASRAKTPTSRRAYPSFATQFQCSVASSRASSNPSLTAGPFACSRCCRSCSKQKTGVRATGNVPDCGMCHRPAVESVSSLSASGATLESTPRFCRCLHPCTERRYGVLPMTARSSAATIKATAEQGGAP